MEHCPSSPPTVHIAACHPEMGGRLPWPRRMTEHAAGYDVVAAIDAPVTLAPRARAKVPLGFALGLPPGTEAQIRPRSGLAAKHGVTCLNAPGTIDADYTGEVQVILINHGDMPFVVEPGMRVAQMVIAQVLAVRMAQVATLTPTARGASGFGSTGT